MPLGPIRAFTLDRAAAAQTARHHSENTPGPTLAAMNEVADEQDQALWAPSSPVDPITGAFVEMALDGTQSPSQDPSPSRQDSRSSSVTAADDEGLERGRIVDGRTESLNTTEIRQAKARSYEEALRQKGFRPDLTPPPDYLQDSDQQRLEDVRVRLLFGGVPSFDAVEARWSGDRRLRETELIDHLELCDADPDLSPFLSCAEHVVRNQIRFALCDNSVSNREGLKKVTGRINEIFFYNIGRHENPLINHIPRVTQKVDINRFSLSSLAKWPTASQSFFRHLKAFSNGAFPAPLLDAAGKPRRLPSAGEMVASTENFLASLDPSPVLDRLLGNTHQPELTKRDMFAPALGLMSTIALQVVYDLGHFDFDAVRSIWGIQVTPEVLLSKGLREEHLALRRKWDEIYKAPIKTADCQRKIQIRTQQVAQLKTIYEQSAVDFRTTLGL